jgi:TPR repeat protein
LCAAVLDLDLIRAQELFNLGRVLDAAKLGLPEAQGEMGARYFYGTHGEDKDMDNGLEWATKAARGGDMQAQRLLGSAFGKGIGQKKDEIEAMRWWGLAADQGCADSMHAMGLILQVGRGGVPQNLQRSFELFLDAAKVGHRQAIAKVGMCFYRGDGVDENLTEARKWFAKGNRQSATSKFMLGHMMVRGEGGLREFHTGMTLIEVAANGGCAQAIALRDMHSSVHI